MTAAETGIDVLDCRHPIRSDHPIQTFATLLRGWPDRLTVLRQTELATRQTMVAEERFIQPAPETLTLRAIEAPLAPLPPLAPAALQRDWDTQPGTVTHWYDLDDTSDCDD